MRRPAASCLLACLVVSVAFAGKEAPDKPSASPSVEKLIEQLGDQDFARRDAANKGLAALGPEALPALRKATNHSDLEVRRRVEALVAAIETAATLAPKLVSLHAEKKTVRQVAQEIARQTGYPIDVMAGNDELVYDFNFDKV